MAAWQIHLRFDRYFGGSKYRPSEGWIDVTSVALWQPYGMQQSGNQHSGGAARPNKKGSLSVDCVSDRATTLLIQAFAEGRVQSGNAVLEFRKGTEWIRFSMTDVVLADATVHDGRISLTLECEQPKHSSNAKSAVHK